MTGTVPSGNTFVEYSVPGGRTVKVMDGEILRKALNRSNNSIRDTIAGIQRRHGHPTNE